MVPLHVHSCFSLFDGTASPGAIAKRVVEMGLPAFALTDTFSVSGMMEAYKASKGTRMIIGAEVRLSPTPLASLGEGAARQGYRVELLAMDTRGYQNLCRIVSAASRRVHFGPWLDVSLVEPYAEGLLALTGDHHGLLRLPEGVAHDEAERLAMLFPGRLYVELTDTGVVGLEDLPDRARQLARRLGLPLVATGPAHYLSREDAVLLDALHAVRRGVKLTEATGDHPTDQCWLRSEDEIRQLFPDDSDAVAMSDHIAERCTFVPDTKNYYFPRSDPPADAPDASKWKWLFEWFPPPASFRVSSLPGFPVLAEGRSIVDAYFEWYARVGLERRLEANPLLDRQSYTDRLDLEIDLIGKMGFSAYMLIVAEFINWAKDRKIPVGPGRGSVAGALTAWAMKITEIDSIFFGLYFERFLNPARKSMPDVDVDFGQARRAEVVQHVADKYGAECVGQILTYGTFGAKSVFKDVSRAMGIFYNDANELTDDIGDTLKESVQKGAKHFSRYEVSPVFRATCDIGIGLEGLVRQWGIHAAGVVITPRPLTDFAPVHFNPESGQNVLAFDMAAVESLGLIKYDFLGLKTLDVIEETLDAVEAATGVRPDMDTVPLDDPAVFELLSAGDTEGIFQVESSGMRDLLLRLKPSHIEEIIAIVALYRPGPIKTGMIGDYVDRKNGISPITYPHPIMEPIFSPTYGVMTYQEQLMRLAQEMSGYSMGEADLLRRAIAKKKAKEMEEQRARFVGGALERGVPEDVAKMIFGQIEGFADYCFNKAHSASYGVITYRTAWLKAHYREAFLAASMSWDAGDEEKTLAYLADCRRAEIPVLQPDINHSQRQFTARGGHVLYGLIGLKGVGEKAVEAILAEREARGPFVDARDFAERIDRSHVTKTVFHALSGSGAFDALGVSREVVWRFGDSKPDKKASVDQLGLFAAGVIEEAPCEPWDHDQRMAKERKALGIWLTGHPMDRYGRLVELLRSCPLHLLSSQRDAQDYELVGVVASAEEKVRFGETSALLVLGDPVGQARVICPPDRWSTLKPILKEGQAVHIVVTKVRPGHDTPFFVRTAEPLDEAFARSARMARVVVPLSRLDGRGLDDFEGALKAHPGPCGVLLVLDRGEDLVTLKLADTLSVDPRAPFFAAMERFLGRTGAVSVLARDRS